MCFLRNGSSYSFETCTTAIGTPENLRVHWVWPSKYKGKWCFNPKCIFSETDHHTALKLGPLQLAHLKTSGCAEFGPLNTMESDVLTQNVFSQKWIIIQLWKPCNHPENLRVHWVWHNGKWCFNPKCEMDHHTGCTEFGPLNTKESDVSAQNVYLSNWHTWKEGAHLNTKESHVLAQNVFSQKQTSYSFETCTTAIGTPEKSAWLKTSGCTEFGPLNTMESDVSGQDVFSQKWIIIQLWNLYHCNWHTWKPQGVLSLAL